MTRPVVLVARAAALALSLSGAAGAFAAPSPADGAATPAAPAPIRPLVGVMLTGNGSDTKGTFKNPDGTEAYGSLGGRYEAFAGAEFPIDPNGLTLRLTGGLHATAALANSRGGSQHVTSIPLEATLWYPINDQLRLGGGARYALHTRFSGAGNKTSDGLSATPGLVFGAGYRLMPHLLLELRYVYERYEQANGGSDVEASHWGAGLTAIY